MVSANTVKPGDTVRDNKLGLIWTFVGYDPDGDVQIERHGVIAVASFWDLERWRDLSPAIAQP